MANDVLLNKAESIERCLKRIEEDYVGYEHELESNYTRQDAIILNLQRACESSIDAAMHIVRIKKLGLPQESREAFEILEKNKVISSDLAVQLKKMVGFRNIAIHNYQKINLQILKAILQNNLDDFRLFVKVLIEESK